MEEYNIKIVAKDSNFYPGKLVAQKGQIRIAIKTNNLFMFKMFVVIIRCKNSLKNNHCEFVCERHLEKP